MFSLKKTAMICVALGLLGGTFEAAALSCMQSTPQTAFAKYDSAPEEYHVYEGTLTPLEPIPAQQDEYGRGITRTVTAEFLGSGVGPDGLTLRRRRFNVEVTLQCAASWCGGFAPNQPYVFFMEYRSNGSYALDVSPCGGSTFEANSTHRRQIQACFRGECSDPNYPPVTQPHPEPTPPEFPQNKDMCGKAYLEDLVGDYAQKLPPYLRNNTHVRILTPDSVISLDHVLTRLNIHTGYDNRIERMACG